LFCLFFLLAGRFGKILAKNGFFLLALAPASVGHCGFFWPVFWGLCEGVGEWLKAAFFR